jgi:hypothetical protein
VIDHLNPGFFARAISVIAVLVAVFVLSAWVFTASLLAAMFLTARLIYRDTSWLTVPEATFIDCHVNSPGS